jgi:hypothetical protein
MEKNVIFHVKIIVKPVIEKVTYVIVVKVIILLVMIVQNLVATALAVFANSKMELAMRMEIVLSKNIMAMIVKVIVLRLVIVNYVKKVVSFVILVMIHFIMELSVKESATLALTHLDVIRQDFVMIQQVIVLMMNIMEIIVSICVVI